MVVVLIIVVVIVIEIVVLIIVGMVVDEDDDFFLGFWCGEFFILKNEIEFNNFIFFIFIIK